MVIAIVIAIVILCVWLAVYMPDMDRTSLTPPSSPGASAATGREERLDAVARIALAIQDSDPGAHACFLELLAELEWLRAEIMRWPAKPRYYERLMAQMETDSHESVK